MPSAPSLRLLRRFLEAGVGLQDLLDRSLDLVPFFRQRLNDDRIHDTHDRHRIGVMRPRESPNSLGAALRLWGGPNLTATYRERRCLALGVDTRGSASPWDAKRASVVP